MRNRRTSWQFIVKNHTLKDSIAESIFCIIIDYHDSANAESRNDKVVSSPSLREMSKANDEAIYNLNTKKIP